MIARGRPAPAAAALAVAGVVACGGGRSFEVPAPAVGPGAAPPPPIEAATIALPVEVSLAPVLAQLEAAFPRVDSLDRQQCVAAGGFVCHQYVYQRDPLDLRMEGDRVQLVARMRYRGRVALPGVGALASCGYPPEAMRRAELRVTTALYWRVDWRLASRETAVGAALTDPCAVTALRVNATPLMRRIVDGQLATARRQLDSAVPALADLRPAADSLWRSTQEPIALDSASTAWLTMQPTAVRLAPVRGEGGVVRSAVVLTARPRVVVGARPAVRVAPLPPLSLAPPASGLHVPVEVELPFAELGARATALLRGETAGQGLRVTGVSVWGAAADTAVVRIGLDGRLRGSLFMVGRVGYDSVARALAVRDLRYTVASADMMSRIKATLAAPLIRRALDDATGHGRLDVGAQLDSARLQLERELNRTVAPGVALAGRVRTLRVTGIYTTATAFLVRVVLDGEARLEMR